MLHFDTCCIRKHCVNRLQHILHYLGRLVNSANDTHEDISLFVSVSSSVGVCLHIERESEIHSWEDTEAGCVLTGSVVYQTRRTGNSTLSDLNDIILSEVFPPDQKRLLSLTINTLKEVFSWSVVTVVLLSFLQLVYFHVVTSWTSHQNSITAVHVK